MEKAMLGGRRLLGKSARMGKCRELAKKSISTPPSVDFILTLSYLAPKGAIVIYWCLSCARPRIYHSKFLKQS